MAFGPGDVFSDDKLHRAFRARWNNEMPGWIRLDPERPCLLHHARSVVVYETAGTVYFEYCSKEWRDQTARMKSWNNVSRVYDVNDMGTIGECRRSEDRFLFFQSASWIEDAVAKVREQDWLADYSREAIDDHEDIINACIVDPYD